MVNNMGKDEVRLSARAAAAGQIVIAIAALFIASGVIGLIVTPFVPEALRTPLLGLAMWGAVIAGGILLKRSHASYADIGLRRPESGLACAGWTLAAIVLSFAGTLLIGYIIQVTTDWPALDVGYIRHSIEGNLSAYLIWIGLVVWGSAAFGEELLARGFIMDRLQVLFGRGKAGIGLAILGQAVVFGLLHAIQGPTGIVLTAWVGIVFAVTYFAAGRNLWPVILAHGLVDTLSLTIMYLGLPLPGHIQ